MAIQVPVQNVESQRHLSVLVTHVKDGAPNGQVKMETYSGWIRVNFGSSSLAPEKVVSFLSDEGKKIPTYNGPADLRPCLTVAEGSPRSAPPVARSWCNSWSMPCGRRNIVNARRTTVDATRA